MDRRTLQEQPQTFRTLVGSIRRRSLWDPQQESATIESRISDVTDGTRQRGELLFDHRRTSARLTMLFPGYETGDVAELLLDNPLDTALRYGETGFVGKLCTAHHAIGSRNGTPYTEAVGSPSLLLRARIPPSHEMSTVRETLTAFESAVSESERLHAELFRVLETYDN